nr:DNA-directed RNA polymerase IV subunit 1 isoform X1 [Tanacetum cinerariifolium]
MSLSVLLGSSILSEGDAEKVSVKEIMVSNEVTDPVLGFPNPASQCHTCGAKDYRTCEEVCSNETTGNRHPEDFSLSTLCTELEIPSLHPSDTW